MADLFQRLLIILLLVMQGVAEGGIKSLEHLDMAYSRKLQLLVL